MISRGTHPDNLVKIPLLVRMTWALTLQHLLETVTNLNNTGTIMTTAE